MTTPLISQPSALAISPIANNFTQRGQFDPTHLSNVSIHYSPSTLPTPWPILLTGLLWSIFSSIAAILNQLLVKRETKKGIPFACILNSFLASIQFIRCLTAFIGGVNALDHDGAGRFRPPSAVVVLLVSTLPYCFPGRTPRMFRALAALGTLFAAMTLVVMVCLRLKADNHYYAKWFVTSTVGNCSVVVDQLNIPTVCWNYVGCGLHRKQVLDGGSSIICIKAKNPNTWGLRNRLAFGETFLGLVLLLPLLVTGGATIILLPIAIGAVAWLFYFIVECFMDPFDYDDDDAFLPSPSRSTTCSKHDPRDSGCGTAMVLYQKGLWFKPTLGEGWTSRTGLAIRSMVRVGLTFFMWKHPLIGLGFPSSGGAKIKTALRIGSHFCKVLTGQVRSNPVELILYR